MRARVFSHSLSHISRSYATCISFASPICSPAPGKIAFQRNRSATITVRSLITYVTRKGSRGAARPGEVSHSASAVNDSNFHRTDITTDTTASNNASCGATTAGAFRVLDPVCSQTTVCNIFPTAASSSRPVRRGRERARIASRKTTAYPCPAGYGRSKHKERGDTPDGYVKQDMDCSGNNLRRT